MTVDRRELMYDPEELLREAMDGHAANLWTAIPGVIEAVNAEKMTCSVQPTIQQVSNNPDGSQVVHTLPLLVDVPMCWPGGGGFTMTLPTASLPGTEVLVVFASRCIDAWWQHGGVQPPLEARTHDLSDGFAIFSPKSNPNVIPDISADTLQIRSDDGHVVIDVGDDHITTTAGSTSINIVDDGNVTVTAGTELIVNTPLAAFSGTVTADNFVLTPAHLNQMRQIALLYG